MAGKRRAIRADHRASRARGGATAEEQAQQPAAQLQHLSKQDAVDRIGGTGRGHGTGDSGEHRLELLVELYDHPELAVDDPAEARYVLVAVVR